MLELADKSSINSYCNSILQVQKGGGEVAVWLRTFAALVEDPDLDPSTHIEQCAATCNSSPRESNILFWSR